MDGRGTYGCNRTGDSVMQIMIALVAFLLGAVSVFAIELQVLNDTLTPIRELIDEINAVAGADLSCLRMFT
jgi:hypothetical protein